VLRPHWDSRTRQGPGHDRRGPGSPAAARSVHDPRLRTPGGGRAGPW